MQIDTINIDDKKYFHLIDEQGNEFIYSDPKDELNNENEAIKTFEKVIEKIKLLENKNEV